MNLHNLIFQHLSGDSNLNALGKRMSPDIAPPGQSVPYLVWQRVSGETETAWDGTAGGDFPLWQFTVWAKARSNAEVLRNLLRTSLEGEELGGAAISIEDYQDLVDTTDANNHLYGALMEVRFHISGK